MTEISDEYAVAWFKQNILAQKAALKANKTRIAFLQGFQVTNLSLEEAYDHMTKKTEVGVKLLQVVKHYLKWKGEKGNG